MNVDMKGISADHEGKRLRIEFTDGEICEAELLMICTCDEHSSCCGIVFDLLETNLPEKHGQALLNNPYPAIWSEIEFVKRFEVVERKTA